ncbi:MAG: glycerophosphodiester phosphodiesterase [Dehalococcoidia bacterium]|nr:glycerophosphodiester phosphodiesterase [Dehalococcoidia bacterium]
MNLRIFSLLCLAFHIAALPATPTNDVVKYNGVPGTTRVQIYGHRGCRGLLPEQTMPAYAAALRMGVDYVDMDVGMTKDGVLVITHDLTLNPDLTRDANGQWITNRIPVRSLTLQELRTYDVGRLKPGTRYASCFPCQRPVDHTPIPTLGEVVRFVNETAGDTVGFQIEIKNDPTQPELTASPKEFARALHKLIAEEGIGNRTEIQAFDWRCLVELSKIDKTLKTAYLSDHTTEVMNDTEKGTWTAGVLPKDHGYSLPRIVRHLGGHCWEPFEMDLSEREVDEAHRLGLKVVAWGWPEQEGTEFNYAQTGKLIDWGVDGIITDRPDILRGILAARGMNLPIGKSLAQKAAQEIHDPF